ncbi:MAG: hypothetical protein WBD40_00230 [Tepidisphaeraceae bacterium]
MELSNAAASEQAIRDGQNEEVVLLRDGKPVAMVMPFDEDDLQWYDRERDPAFVASIARGRADVRAGRTASHADLKRQLGIE